MPRLPAPRPGRRLVAAVAVAAVAAAVAVGLLVRGGSGPAYAEERSRVHVLDGPGRDQPVDLDVALFLPRSPGPHPAVILSHGFGGSLEEVRGDALDAVGRGYVVLTYSARGFGRSTGLVGLDSPDYEVVDVQQLLTLLAGRPEVLQDGPGDPRVGLAGGSYGGGISLLTAAYDPRVDAVAAAITWNDLATAFSPGGVFKQGWASLFFGLGTLKPAPGGREQPRVCPGFVPEVCAVYAGTEAAGAATPDALQLLHRSSVAGVVDRLKVPTLLLQGEQDTLFPLGEADATAAALARNGVPHKEVWLRGGHDAGFGAETTRVRDLTGTWFDRWLRRDAAVGTGAAFEAARPGAPGLAVADRAARGGALSYALAGRGPQTVVNPPGGVPAALSSLPGLGQLTSLAPNLTIDLPPQTAAFDGPRLAAPVEVVGGGTAHVRVASSTGTAVLFAKLYDVDAEGTARLPAGQLTPLRLAGLPTAGPGQDVTVALPAISWRFAPGHHLRLALATTDQAWLGSRAPASYTVDAVDLEVPLSPAPAGGGLRPLVLAGLVLLVLALLGALAGLLAARRRGRDRVVSAAAASSVADRADPVVIRGLTKAYAGGLTAVDDLDLTVRSGQVLGLLGPNGAGKTTTLRMLLGLIRPSGGEIRLFGTLVAPGSPALARVGAFVEGPGFVPTLSGLDNLRLWWTATGARWEDAHHEEALAVAGLGDAVHRRVKTYSQGMRQRLAIAQAMLGRPDLVVLDEPTNGLDPPQIVEMRRVIRELAERGTTVLVSSHLLSEVEQVCTHVAVMARGRLVATGTVEEVIGADGTVHLEVPAAALDVAERVLLGVPGVTEVSRDATGLLVALVGTPRSALVAALVHAEVPVEAVTPRRALEEAFLELVG